MINEQAWIGSLSGLNPILGSSAASFHYLKKLGKQNLAEKESLEKNQKSSSSVSSSLAFS